MRKIPKTTFKQAHDLRASLNRTSELFSDPVDYVLIDIDTSATV